MAVFIDFMAVFKDMFTVLCLRVFIISYDLEYEFLLIFSSRKKRTKKSQSLMKFAAECLGLTCLFFPWFLQTVIWKLQSYLIDHGELMLLKKNLSNIIITLLCCWMNLFCSNIVAVTGRNLLLLGLITTNSSGYTCCVWRCWKLCMHKLLV